MIDRKRLIPAFVKGSKPEELFSDILEKLIDLKDDMGALKTHVDIHVLTDDELIDFITPLIPEPEEPRHGKTPTRKELLALIKPLIPEPKKGDPGKNGTEIKPEEVRDKIKGLKGDKRLSIFDLKDWEWLRGKGKQALQFTSAAINIITDATLTGNGTAESPLHAVGGGSGITVITPTGTVTGFNAVFTSATAPKWIVSDSSTYFPGAGFTYAGTTITMDVPPSQFIRAII